MLKSPLSFLCGFKKKHITFTLVIYTKALAMVRRMLF